MASMLDREIAITLILADKVKELAGFLNYLKGLTYKIKKAYRTVKKLLKTTDGKTKEDIKMLFQLINELKRNICGS